MGTSADLGGGSALAGCKCSESVCLQLRRSGDPEIYSALAAVQRKKIDIGTLVNCTRVATSFLRSMHVLRGQL